MQKVLLTLAAALLFTACRNAAKTETTTETKQTETTASAVRFDPEKTTLTWTAFKTPDKVGVSGSFDDIRLDGNSFIINTRSVNSGSGERDAKLKSFLFGNLSDSLITGSYGTITDGKIPVTIKMNGIEKTFDFDLTEADTATIVKGSIDILADFKGQKGFDALHEACKALHLNKTWSDVGLTVMQKK